MTRGVGAARFAVLSACETARAGGELTDEIVSLPTALLQCGLASVVASLWEVFDKPTAMIMSASYQNWRQEGLSPRAGPAQCSCGRGIAATLSARLGQLHS
jgi:CHAT domain-containing protein